MDDIIVPELQNVDTTLIIDPDTRTIDVGSDFLLGVETDNDAERVKFQCSKIVGDNLDLSQYHIYIHYQNAKGEKGKYLCEDIEDSGENITFSWLLSQKAVLYKGQTKFLVCAKKTQEDTIVWNTTLANGNVLEGLDVDEDIVQQNDDVIEQILLKLEQIEASGGSYTLPIATPTQLGGVKPVAKTDEMTQEVGVDEAGGLFTKEGDGIDEETLNQINKNTEDISKLSDSIDDLKGGTYSSIEPADDDIPKVFFDEAIPQTKNDVVTKFRYISKTQDISGYAEFKAQGNSSMNYPKKNVTVKMYQDEALETKLKLDFKGWGKQSKHVYKANWIDLTHSRNIVSARIWADVVKSRSEYESYPSEFKASPNQGAVDGFPIKVYSQGIYQGRYTLNIPKDKWTFNMDDELDEHCILCSENYVSGCFRATANINGSDWTDEIHDTVPSTILTRWNEVVSFVMNSSDDEFKTNLSNYFYIDSLIDYLIFGIVSCGLDAFGKNQIYATYDGQKWIANMYDMDSTWGLYWNGSSFVSANYSRAEFEDFVQGRQGNLLYIRLAELFGAEIKARYEELKKGVLSIPNIINHFERFTDIAPLDLVKEDYASTTGSGKFTVIPSKDTNNIQQIRKFVVDRYAYCDEYFESNGGSGGEVEPDEPTTPDNPEVTLSSISATYSGGDVAIGTKLTDLQGLTVKGIYSDGSTKNLNDYTLNGTINEGENTIVVSYSGMTTTFVVVGYIDLFGWSNTASYAIETDGSIVSGDNYVTDFIEIEKGKMYELSNGSGEYTYLGIAFYDSNKNFVRILHNQSNTTVPCYGGFPDFADVAYVKLKAYPNKKSENNKPSSQLVFKEVERIYSNANTYEIATKTGEIKNGNGFTTLKPIEVEVGATYTFTCQGSSYPRIIQYDENMNYIKGKEVSSDTVTDTMETNTKYVRLNVYSFNFVYSTSNLDNACSFIKN